MKNCRYRTNHHGPSKRRLLPAPQREAWPECHLSTPLLSGGPVEAPSGAGGQGPLTAGALAKALTANEHNLPCAGLQLRQVQLLLGLHGLQVLVHSFAARAAVRRAGSTSNIKRHQATDSRRCIETCIDAWIAAPSRFNLKVGASACRPQSRTFNPNAQKPRCLYRSADILEDQALTPSILLERHMLRKCATCEGST